MAQEDKALLCSYRRGNKYALEALVEKYRRPLFSYINGMVAGQDDPDDIFQETWLKAITQIGSYRRPKNFFGWLVRIAHNAIIDRIRRRRQTESLDERPDEERTWSEVLPGKGDDPARRAEMRELRARLAAAIDTLPDAQKEVFMLRVAADMPFKEIARVQRVPLGTALARMQYALSKLQALLKEDYEQLRR